MANSIITYEGDGVTTQYAINFTLGNLNRDYVKCRVGTEVDGLGAPVYRTLEWVTDGLVNIQGTVPADGVAIVFTRTMPKNALLHNYSDGAAIVEGNLDQSNLQHIMSIHEFLDGRLEGGFVQDITMNGYKITDLGDGTDAADAVNKGQLDVVQALAEGQSDLAEAWATKTNGAVADSEYSAKAYALGGTGVTNTAGKGAAKEWATKAEDNTVDGTEYSAKHYSAKTAADRVQTGLDRVATGNDVVTTGNNVTLAQAAQSAAEAAANGMKWRPSVLVATTENITLSGEQTVDGVLTASSRVLVKDQSTASQNGVYISSSGAWTRATDADTWAELVGQVVVTEEGSTQSDKPYICTVNNGGTLGSTAITWEILPSAIADGSVTTTKIANSAVTGEKLGTISSAELRGALSDETGTGTAVFNNTPTLLAPLLRDPTDSSKGISFDMTGAFASSVATLRSWMTANRTIIMPDKSGTLAMLDDQKIVQVLRVEDATLSSAITVATPYDDTIPQQSEMTIVLSQAITPTDAGNYLLLLAEVQYGVGTGVQASIGFFQDSTANALSAKVHSTNGNTAAGVITLNHRMLAGTTSETTLKVGLSTYSGGSLRMNGVTGGTRLYGGSCISNFTIIEMRP